MTLFCFGVFIVFIQAFRVPVLPIGAGLDASFPYILNLGASSGAKFGTDIIYTYGPLGFLLVLEDVGRNLLAGFVFWSITYLAFAVVIVHFVLRHTQGVRTVLGLSLAAAVSTVIDADRLFSCFVILLLFEGYHEPRYRRLIIASCGIIAAIGLLMKVTIGIGCLGATLASSLVPFNSIREITHRVTIALTSSVATLCTTWVLINGTINGMGAYFYNSLQMSAGYTASMSLSRPDEGVSLAIFLVAMTLLAIYASVLPRWRNLHSLAIIVPSIAIAWKHGVVRYDESHVFALVIILSFSTFCVLISHLTERPDRKSKPGSSHPLAYCGQVVSISAAVSVIALTATALKIENIKLPAQLAGGIKPLSNFIRYSEYRQRLRHISDSELAGHRIGPDQLKSIGRQTVDIYSYELGFVAANAQSNWRLKPIFQHFNAFTDHLDRINADFLNGPTAPAFLIMHHPNDSIAGVDGRHQLFDDPLAFLQIIRHYRTTFVETDATKPQIGLLERTDANQRSNDPIILKSEKVRWNSTIPLPAISEPAILRVKVDLRNSISSKIKEAIFRLNPIYLVYILSDGSEQKFRLMPPHMQSGIWISPHFENYSSLYAFLGGRDWLGPKVLAIRFESDNLTDYNDPLAISWEQIVCEGATRCQPVSSRFFSALLDKQKATPSLIRPKIVIEMPVPVNTIQAIEIRLSTYGKVNKGILTLVILDENGKFLGQSRLDAALVRDNGYAAFTFDHSLQVGGGKPILQLSYQPVGDGAIAAWKSSETANDLDIRAYGN